VCLFGIGNWTLSLAAITVRLPFLPIGDRETTRSRTVGFHSSSFSPRPPETVGFHSRYTPIAIDLQMSMVLLKSVKCKLLHDQNRRVQETVGAACSTAQ
jgi:hypothetical protein